MRVAEIKSYDFGTRPDAPSIVISYRYGKGENGAGVVKYYPKPDYMVNERLNFYFVENEGLFAGVRSVDYISMYVSEAFQDLASVGPMYYPRGKYLLYRPDVQSRRTVRRNIFMRRSLVTTMKCIGGMHKGKQGFRPIGDLQGSTDLHLSEHTDFIRLHLIYCEKRSMMTKET